MHFFKKKEVNSNIMLDKHHQNIKKIKALKKIFVDLKKSENINILYIVLSISI
jgi:hypothetical protein